MAKAYKVLGQALPNSATYVDLYTVPAGASAVVSTLAICNTSAANVTFRAAVRKGGNAITTAQFFAYDVALPAQDTVGLTLGITMASADVLTVYSYQGSVTFNLFGAEIT
jgi:hypothetical protein